MNDYIETNDVKICSDDPTGQFGELFQVKQTFFCLSALLQQLKYL